MQKIISISAILMAASLITITLTANADVLTLKDGQKITGKFVSRDANKVIFEIAGQQLNFDNAKVTSISFAEPVSMKKDQPEAKAEKPEKVTVLAGTRMIVRTDTALSTNKHATGHKFTAKLEADMVVKNVVVAPRGSTLYGVVTKAQKSRRLVGKAAMDLTFTDIMINNKMIQIKTSVVKSITEAEAKKTLGKTAKAAAIGGLIDGSDGAKTGAKVGIGLSLLSGGKSIDIPASSLLEFQIAAPFTP